MGTGTPAIGTEGEEIASLDDDLDDDIPPSGAHTFHQLDQLSPRGVDVGVGEVREERDDVDFVGAVFHQPDGFDGLMNRLRRAVRKAADGADENAGVLQAILRVRDVRWGDADGAEVVLNGLGDDLVDVGDAGLGFEDGVVDAGG